MAKQLAFNGEARAAIARGVSKLARAVKVTLRVRGGEMPYWIRGMEVLR